MIAHARQSWRSYNFPRLFLAVPDEVPSLSRRGFLQKMSTATAFLFGFSVPAAARSAPLPTPRPLHRMPFIRIDGQGEVTLIMPQVEMGQGTYTSISTMILAEELDAGWSLVRVKHAPANEETFTLARTWASGGRETRPRSARSGNLCA